MSVTPHPQFTIQEIEQRVVSALLHDPQLMLHHGVFASHFEHQTLAHIVATMRDLMNSDTPLNAATISEASNTPLDIVEGMYLSFTRSMRSSIDEYIRILLEHAQKRDVARYVRELYESVVATPASEMPSLIRSARDRIEDLAQTRQDVGFGPDIGDIFDDFGTSEPPISTGFEKIDGVISGGFMPGRCYVFSGPQKSGKTTLARNAALHMLIESGRRICHVGFDGGRPRDIALDYVIGYAHHLAYLRQIDPHMRMQNGLRVPFLTQRVVSAFLADKLDMQGVQVSADLVDTVREAQEFLRGHSIQQTKHGCLHIINSRTTGLSMAGVTEFVERATLRAGIDTVIYDHFSLFAIDNERDETRRSMERVLHIHRLQQRYPHMIPIVIAQLTREHSDGDPTKFTTAGLAYGQPLEQHADVVFRVVRGENPHEVSIYVPLNRVGPSGVSVPLVRYPFSGYMRSV